jgi:hypothetical protein
VTTPLSRNAVETVLGERGRQGCLAFIVWIVGTVWRLLGAGGCIGSDKLAVGVRLDDCHLGRGRPGLCRWPGGTREPARVIASP